MSVYAGDASGRVVAMCLAAGASMRMGSPKQLLVWHGETILQRSLRALLMSEVEDVVVVLGANFDKIAQSIRTWPAPRPLTIVNNQRWEEGMASSLMCGLRHFVSEENHESQNWSGVMVALGDMPFVETASINRLIAAHREYGPQSIVIPLYGGRRGHPVIFGRAYAEELLHLQGDRGASSVVRGHQDHVVLVDGDNANLTDIDTPEEWRRYSPQE